MIENLQRNYRGEAPIRIASSWFEVKSPFRLLAFVFAIPCPAANGSMCSITYNGSCYSQVLFSSGQPQSMSYCSWFLFVITLASNQELSSALRIGLMFGGVSISLITILTVRPGSNVAEEGNSMKNHQSRVSSSASFLTTYNIEQVTLLVRFSLSFTIVAFMSGTSVFPSYFSPNMDLESMSSYSP